ncbi:hypothetical protein L211DRAFT_880930 [Terfezia boudieri ATCC MYA-4762]|uniref:DUF6589 domain-containing protein n=1 Tax=Terfezia boudieri ATCC MYA-4762 TaxID=1051890 RepID=A0A3N4LLA7_9PEZI|nr:hypothetical protein L211DRAFT_880930 [Terfezia boudieri ATCC MYA-4762]
MPESHLEDPSEHPKFNPTLGRIERRGRPRKTAIPLEAQAAKQGEGGDGEEDEDSGGEVQACNRKLEECMNVIAKNFVNIHSFLLCWDSTNSSARDKFLRKGGAAEMVQRWLPVARGLSGGMIKDSVAKICAEEVKAIERQRECPLRYVQMDRTAESRVSLHGNIKSNLDEMREFLEFHAPLGWGVLRALGQGSIEKKNANMSTLGAFANVLNGRNQRLNAFQTIITVYLYCNGLNKSAVEVLHRLNMCASYSHLNEVLHQLSRNMGDQLKEDVSNIPMRITIDNVNLFSGVRDTTSINQAQLNNSTGGYITPVRGVPPGISKLLPRSWLNLGARVKLDPRELKASPEALRFMKSWNKWYICTLLKNHIVKKLEGEEYPRPEVHKLEAEAAAIYTTELMDIPQDSIMGNHTSVRKILTEVLGYSLQEVMDGLYLVGGDQLLADRIRSIQKLMEGDIPGEDFSSVIMLLGPLHTLMNIKKLIMCHHIGAMDGSVLGSLMAFNKSLKRDRKIDSEAKDLWACMDLTKDSLDTILLALAVEEGTEDKTWASFARGVGNGDINWHDVVESLTEKLSYGYVANCRRRQERERDKVLENILLFARQELEFRAFYMSMRHGDVGAMELVLQLWGPQCLAGNQVKYGHELLDIRCGMLADWSQEL